MLRAVIYSSSRNKRVLDIAIFTYNVIPNMYLSVPSKFKDTSNNFICHLILCSKHTIYKNPQKTSIFHSFNHHIYNTGIHTHFAVVTLTASLDKFNL